MRSLGAAHRPADSDTSSPVVVVEVAEKSEHGSGTNDQNDREQNTGYGSDHPYPRSLSLARAFGKWSFTCQQKLPDSVLDQNARTTWAQIRDSVKARSWPKLGRPRWMVGVMWVGSLATFAGVWAVSHWLLGIICGLLVAPVAARATCRFRSCVPHRYSCVRDLVPFAVTSEAIAWTRDQVAALVKKLVIEELGLKPGDYWEDAHFVKDLGMG